MYVYGEMERWLSENNISKVDFQNSTANWSETSGE